MKKSFFLPFTCVLIICLFAISGCEKDLKDSNSQSQDFSNFKKSSKDYEYIPTSGAAGLSNLDLKLFHDQANLVYGEKLIYLEKNWEKRSLDILPDSIFGHKEAKYYAYENIAETVYQKLISSPLTIRLLIDNIDQENGFYKIPFVVKSSTTQRPDQRIYFFIYKKINGVWKIEESSFVPFESLIPFDKEHQYNGPIYSPTYEEDLQKDENWLYYTHQTEKMAMPIPTDLKKTK